MTATPDTSAIADDPDLVRRMRLFVSGAGRGVPAVRGLGQAAARMFPEVGPVQ
jgi:hypothetical protein